MRRPRPGTLPRRLIAAIVIATAALAPAAAASAALPGHSGTQGVHVLIDTQEFPGITCHYQLNAPGILKRIAVRRPIVYAPDLTAGRDHRWVGWRYRIQRSTDDVTWTTVASSKIRRAIAYDDQPAALQPSGKNLVGRSGAIYRALIDLWWYTPSGTRTVTGHARHANGYSLMVLDPEAPTVGSCDGSIDPVAAAAAGGRTGPAGTTPAAPPPSHDGAVGLHALVDSFHEYPGAICRLPANGDVRISVRAPAVFAREGFRGAQRVRWRYTIEGLTPTAGPTPFSSTSSWVTSTATEDRAARWAPLRTKTIADPQWPYYVVSVRIEWLDDGLPHAYAIHGPFHKNGATVTGYCFGLL